MLLGAFRLPTLGNRTLLRYGQGYFFAFSTPGKDTGGPGGRKSPSSMGQLSTAEVLRLRATSAVSRDQSVRRSAQDDDSVGVLTKNILNELANQPLRW